MTKRLHLTEALPDDVLALRDDGIPTPALYVGPLYTGNGGERALRALDAQLEPISRERDDEPVSLDGEAAI